MSEDNRNNGDESGKPEGSGPAPGEQPSADIDAQWGGDTPAPSPAPTSEPPPATSPDPASFRALDPDATRRPDPSAPAATGAPSADSAADSATADSTTGSPTADSATADSTTGSPTADSATADSATGSPTAAGSPYSDPAAGSPYSASGSYSPYSASGSYSEPDLPTPDPSASLPELVGARPERDRDDDRKPRIDWSKRSTKIAAGAGALAVFIAVMIVLSWLNSRDYYLVCGADTVTAERGSKFPWGQEALSGKEWQPIQIAPKSECSSRTFATRDELREAFTQVLLDEASSRLRSAHPEDIDIAEKQLQQGLLLTRSMPTRRATIENLQGDVEYWRAAAEVNTVIGELESAATRFKAAADKGPRHSSDALQWSGHAGEIAKELRRGPPELRSDVDLGPDAPPQFAGTETSPAPAHEPGSEHTSSGLNPDRAPPGGALPPQVEPPPVTTSAPDAGLPTGGVLL